MFDIGFSEILVIAIVSLIVIGPERLPKVARTLGHLFGRLQRYVSDVKADISREIELDELRKLQATMQETVRATEDKLQAELATTRSQLTTIGNETQAPVSDPPGNSTSDSPPPPDPQLQLRLDASSRLTRP